MEREEYQDTEIGRIPKEWKVVRLGEVVLEAKPGFACGSRDEGGILQLRMDSISPDGSVTKNGGVRIPLSEALGDYLLRPGDILFNNTNSVDLIGKTAIFRGEFEKCVYSNHITRIRVNPGKVIPEWVLYLFIRLWNLGVFRSLCHRHVHQAGISNRDILLLQIPLPPLPEQKKIAEILSVVDRAIEETDEAIEKTEKLKRGLMEKLLTGGIGHTDFQDTEIGRIPRDWKVVRLGEVCKKTNQIDPKIEPNRVFKYLDVSSVDNKTLRIVDYQKVLGKEAPSRARKLIQKDDVLFATVRPYLRRIVLVPSELDGELCSTAFCVLRPDKIRLNPYYLFLAVSKENFVARISEYQRGSSYPAVTDNEVLEQKIPLPPLPEQKKIAEILMTVDRKIELLRKKRELLGQVKKGLMEDLLTGRVRVLKLLGKEVEHGAVS